MTRLSLLAAVLVAAPVIAAAPARADEIARGVVVRVEADEIYVNLGARAGISEGARLRIKRPIAVRHPVTRARIVDWLPVGAADVTSAGDRLSMAVLEPAIVRQVKVGDIVEIYVVRDERVAPPDEPPDDAPDAPDAPPDDRPLPEVDAETAAVLAVWHAQRGATLPARIAAWEGYLAAHGASPYADAVRADLEALRRLRDEVTPAAPGATRTVSTVAHHAPTRARRGEALPLVFILDDPGAVTSAWLHHRPLGAATYARVLLEREGDATLRGELPAAAVTAPGVEYFVEVVDAHGEPALAVAPTEVEVDADGVGDAFSTAGGQSRLRLASTYLDFATFDDRDGDHTDRFTLTEADIEYRPGGRVWAIRVGVGALHGEGGCADCAWQGDAPVAGFNYGYGEVEVRARAAFSVAGRLVAGVGQDGFGLGVEVRGRIGAPDAANLSLGLSEVAELGFFSDIRFETDPFGRVPVGLSIGVTDQPTNGDLAVRLGADIGYRASRRLEPQLRLSYQGRTVEHAGLGAGLGLALHW